MPIRRLVLSLSLLVALQSLAAPAEDEMPPPVQASPGLLAQWSGSLTSQFSVARQSVGEKATDMLTQAMGLLGVPYRRGGSSEETGFDCSGFVRHMYEKSFGRLLPRRANEQAKATETIDREELKPGDLVFFNTMKRAFSHVGIYVGDGKFIHAPRAGKSIRVDDMREAYWQKRFNGARRVQAEDGQRAKALLDGTGSAGEPRLVVQVGAFSDADKVRDEYNDWDFSHDGRIRQATRMRRLADQSVYQYTIIDMVSPLPEMRNIIEPDYIVFVDTIKEGRYTDTNKLFVPPSQYDFHVTEQDALAWACVIAKKILNGYACS